MAYRGVVDKWSSRGFGFIRCEEFEKDVFIHHTSFGGGELKEGSEIRFDVEDDSRTGKKRACNVEGEGVVKDAPRGVRDSRDRGDRRGGYGGGRYDSRDRGDRRGGDRYDSRDRRPRYDSRDRRPRYDSRDRGYDRRDSRDRR